MHPQRPHAAYDQSTPTRRGGGTLDNTKGFTSFMKCSTRISYPLFSPIHPRNTVTSILVVLPKLRSEEMRVERGRTAAVVNLVTRSTRGGQRRASYNTSLG